jgi:hypothetical protein
MSYRWLIRAVVCAMLFAGFQATQAQNAPPTRPATDEECDPSRWTIDPEVDYSICEEASVRPQQ